ncbi:MAG: hypothetical protein WEE89_07885 [Gemmatimonadota bacterium]
MNKQTGCRPRREPHSDAAGHAKKEASKLGLCHYACSNTQEGGNEAVRQQANAETSIERDEPFVGAAAL